MKKLKNNKGISLIEVLISLAILSISILVISNLVGVGIKTNKRSEINQQGLILGQQILEEIQLLSYEDDKSNINEEKINLPSGMILPRINNGTEDIVYKKEKAINGYNVQITLKENESTNNEETSSNLLPNSSKITFNLNTNKEKVTSIYNEESNIKYEINSNNLYIKIMQDNNSTDRNLFLCNSINDSGNKIGSLEGNDIILKIKPSDNSENNIKINVFNNINSKMNLYILKPYNSNTNIEIENNKGSLSVIDNLNYESELGEVSIGNLYEIKVEIIHNNKVVFEGYANKNLKIK